MSASPVTDETTMSWKEWLLTYSLYLILGVLIVAVVVVEPSFLSLNNLSRILGQASTRGILALGVAGMIVYTGTDLSAGRILGCCAAISASLLQSVTYSARMYPGITEPLNPLVPLLLNIVVGMLFCSINAFGFAVLKMHPFIISLGTQLIAYGSLCLYIDSQAGGAQPLASLDPYYISMVNSSIDFDLSSIKLPYIAGYAAICAVIVLLLRFQTPLGRRFFGGLAAGPVRWRNIALTCLDCLVAYPLVYALMMKVFAGQFLADSAMFTGVFSMRVFRLPYLVIYLAICAMVMWVIWNKTVLGKNMFAIGGNPEAAAVSGVNVIKNIFGVYLVAGVLYGIAGFLEAGRVQSVTTSTGLNYDLDAISGCVIGGVSFTGGVGTIPGVLLGVIILQVINYSLYYLEVNAYLQYIIKGLIIIMAVAIDVRKYINKK